MSALDLLIKMEVTPSVPNDHSYLSTLSDLEQLLGYSMSHCAGLERMFVDKKLFLEIVKKAGSIRHTVSTYSVYCTVLWVYSTHNSSLKPYL